MRVWVILLLFLVGCVQPDHVEETPEPEAPLHGTSEAPESGPAQPTAAPEAKPQFIAHSGWIEALTPTFATLDGKPFEKNGDKMGWFFLEPETEYEIQFGGNSKRLQTGNSPIGPLGWVFPGAEAESNSMCQFGAVLRDARYENLYAIIGSECTSINAPVLAGEITPREIGRTIYQNGLSGWALVHIHDTEWENVNLQGIERVSKPSLRTNLSANDDICTTTPPQVLGFGFSGPLCGKIEGTSKPGNIFYTNTPGHFYPGSPVTFQDNSGLLGIHVTSRVLGGTAAVAFCTILNELEEQGFELQMLHGDPQPMSGTHVDVPSGYNPEGVFGGTINCTPETERLPSIIDVEN